MNNKEILLFIPTLNEEKHIKIILEKLEKYKNNFDLLVIDDNSSDNTVKNFNSHNGKISKSIIVRKNISGIGSAHLDAIKYAIIVINDIICPDIRPLYIFWIPSISDDIEFEDDFRIFWVAIML